MNVVQLVMGVSILGLLIVISILLPQVTSANEVRVQAEELSAVSKQLLRNNGVVCTARNHDLTGVIECIRPALQSHNFNVLGSGFRPFNEARNETGVIIATNQGARVYDGSQFVLYKNAQEIARGCHITGEILQDYTCRFELTNPCSQGDVFEIRYEQENDEDIRLATQTC